MDQLRTRNWCFTINNYHTNDDCCHDYLQFLDFYNEDYVTYIVLGYEEAPTTGTPHIQGFMHLSQPATKKCLIKKYPYTSFESMKGSYRQASDYCKKGLQSSDEFKELHHKGPNFGLLASFLEYGELPLDSLDKTRKMTGVSTGVTTKIVEAIADGKDLMEINEMFPAYTMTNKLRVINRIRDRNQNKFTQADRNYYIVANNEFTIPLVNNYFESKSESIKMQIVNDLSELEAFVEYDTVLLMTDDTFTIKYNRYAQGQEIVYKSGYEPKVLRCKNFVLSTYVNKKYCKPVDKWVPIGNIDDKPLTIRDYGHDIDTEYEISSTSYELDDNDDIVPKKKPVVPKAKINFKKGDNADSDNEDSESSSDLSDNFVLDSSSDEFIITVPRKKKSKWTTNK